VEAGGAGDKRSLVGIGVEQIEPCDIRREVRAGEVGRPFPAPGAAVVERQHRLKLQVSRHSRRRLCGWTWRRTKSEVHPSRGRMPELLEKLRYCCAPGAISWTASASPGRDRFGAAVRSSMVGHPVLNCGEKGGERATAFFSRR